MTGTGLFRMGALVFAALTLIVSGDTAGKLLTSGGVPPFFVAWSRFVLGALLVLPLAGLRIGELRRFLDWRVLLRAALIAGSISSILTALRTEPIANVFGGFFIGPVVSYFLAALVLHEPLDRRRTGLLLIGFIGVMIVVRPGFGLRPGMLFAVLAGCLHGSFLVTTRWLAPEIRPRLLLLTQLVLGALLLTPLGLSVDWPEPEGPLLGLVLLSAAGSASGNYLLVRANQSAPASFIAPLIYLQLVAATAAGVVVFEDWPDAVTIAGLAVIAVSGMASLLLRRSG